MKCTGPFLKRTNLCACGQPLHYRDPNLQALIERGIAQLGPEVKVVIGNHAWMVPRHYIALHGLRATEMRRLGFPEIEVTPLTLSFPIGESHEKS